MSEFDLMSIPVLRYLGAYYIIADGFEGPANVVAVLGDGLDVLGDQFDPRGLTNAANALKKFAHMQLSEQCKELLNRIGSQAGRSFTAESLQQQADASADSVYDGSSSPTTLSSISVSGTGTVGQTFTGDHGITALSQPNGNAIWVRSATFGSTANSVIGPYFVPAHIGADGQPTPFALGTMVHETMHKFGDDDNKIMSDMHISNLGRAFGSIAISAFVTRICFGQ
jgi:hypothetical protein